MFHSFKRSVNPIAPFVV